LTRGPRPWIGILAATLLAGASSGERALRALTPGNAYLVLEVTDLAAPRPRPFRVKALTRADGRVLARILWPAGDRGVTVLLDSREALAYFPRADLLVTTGGAASIPWQALLDPAAAFRGAQVSETHARCAERPCRSIRAARPPGAPCAFLDLRALPDGTPLRLACLDDEGRTSWAIGFADPVRVGGLARPRSLSYEEAGRLRARARVVFYEPDPPVPESLFTREGLRRLR
jgi:hypothetical protein